MESKCIVCGKDIFCARGTKKYCDVCSEKVASDRAKEYAKRKKKRLVYDPENNDGNWKMKECKTCGRPEMMHANQIYCFECSETKHKKAQIMYQINYGRCADNGRDRMVDRKKPKSNHKSIAEITIAAAKLGMSYGEYVARMGA